MVKPTNGGFRSVKIKSMKEPEVIAQIKKDYPSDQHHAAIEAHADTVRTDYVPDYFSTEALAEMREEYVNRSAEIANTEEQKKAAIAEFDKKLKPLKLENGTLLREIRQGYVENEKRVFDFKDFDQGMVFTYDETGRLLSSRRMNPQDRQTVIKTLSIDDGATGTNG